MEREFRDAVSKVYARQSRLGYKEKLAASLRGDSDRIGAIFEDIRTLRKEKKIDPYKTFGSFKSYGDIDKYRAMITEYEAELANKKTQFDQDHLEYSYGELMAAKTQLTGPVKAMESEMKLAARDILPVSYTHLTLPTNREV